MAQNQHYLPQFYQRRWSAAGERVFVYWRPYDRVVVAQKSTRATGKLAGLYTMPGVPPERANELEDKFWRVIDQWGADCISVLESAEPADAASLVRERWAIFMISLLFRNPIRVCEINKAAEFHYASGFVQFKQKYTELRWPHEPETYEEFIALFQQPGIFELGGRILRELALHQSIIEQLVKMEWNVVSMPNTHIPLLTSDNPIIRYKGLKDVDGLFILPLGPDKFFVALNQGEIEMRKLIDNSISSGRFPETMNQYVVEHAIKYVYGVDDSQLEFVERYLPIGQPTLEPLFAIP